MEKCLGCGHHRWCHKLAPNFPTCSQCPKHRGQDGVCVFRGPEMAKFA